MRALVLLFLMPIFAFADAYSDILAAASENMRGLITITAIYMPNAVITQRRSRTIRKRSSLI
ncbi:hypothetical protein AGMMS50229_03710 [Campylobacterota bacterium]|nr:hypothetical protein AGMMS50229_03710 [Campylobacterota bacterium]